MIRIVCWKWDNGIHPKKKLRFTAEHVNVLRASVSRNLTLEHEFVCVTDDRRGIHPDVRVVNVNRHFPDLAGLGGCYRRLRAFDQVTGIVLFGERFLSIDLDVVVTGNLDKIAGFSDDFRIWSDSFKRRTPYCGSLWGMKAGARESVWRSFAADPVANAQSTKTQKLMGTDQAYINRCLWPNEKVWSVKDGVYNFNTRVRPNGVLPGDARLVFFNGKYDPSQPTLQKQHPWIRDHWHE